VLLAFAPVLFFLTELRLLDSYKLVSRSAAITSIVWGAAAAVACLSIHELLLVSELVDVSTAGRYIAPITVTMTLALFVVVPALVLLVFQRSERATREWLGPGLDLDVELLDLLRSERFDETRMGLYLRDLGDHFPAPTVADMVCLLRLRIELSIQAKALLLARNAGLDLAPDADLEESLNELSSLNHSVGFTGRLVLKPLRVTTARDDWHQHLLTERAASGRLWPTAFWR
jgi:hypothetical protein